MINQKTLIILRHGKTENGTPTGDDHARRLTARGIEAAGIMGKFLFSRGLVPDKVLCSNAVRTSQTFTHLQHEFPAPLNVEYSQKLYHAGTAEILKLIEAVPEDVKTLLVVGHNPGLHQLCVTLAKGGGDEAAIDTLHVKFPTCACAVFGVPTPWYDIAQSRALLQSFTTPVMLGGLEE